MSLSEEQDGPQAHLHEALQKTDASEKDYHVRQAMQLLLLDE